MKVLVYGVTNWDNEQEAIKQAPLVQEWYARLNAHISNISEIFIAPGSFSPPEFCPVDVGVVQIPFYRPLPYSQRNCYFRVGFVTGIWHALLQKDFDILLHCQCRNLIGVSLDAILEHFMNSSQDVLAPAWTSEVGFGIDVGFMAMKKRAALGYCVTGYRQCCDQFEPVINCEDEALLMFENSWYRAFPEIASIRPRDVAAHFENPSLAKSQYNLTPQQAANLPIISANTKYCTGEMLDLWKKRHPLPM